MLRSELKALVKECLIEILKEGLNTSSTPQSVVNDAKKSSITTNEKKNNTVLPQRKSSQLISYNSSVKQKSIQENSIKSTVSTLTVDPLMSSIFADTMKTTMSEQGRFEQSQPSLADIGGNKHIAPLQHITDIPVPATPEAVDMINESSQNWAALAFVPSKDGRKLINS